MADSQPSTSNPKPSSAATRRQYYTKRYATREYLLDALKTWKAVKIENNLKNDKEVAEFLLDVYEVACIRC